MILLSRPMVTNSSSLTGEKQMPEAGALCVLSKLWYELWLLTSHRVTTPLSETLPRRDFLNREYFTCRTGCDTKTHWCDCHSHKHPYTWLKSITSVYTGLGLLWFKKTDMFWPQIPPYYLTCYKMALQHFHVLLVDTAFSISSTSTVNTTHPRWLYELTRLRTVTINTRHSQSNPKRTLGESENILPSFPLYPLDSEMH